MKNSPTSKRTIYKKWKVTAATLDLWIAQGIDIYDDKVMAQKVAEKQPSSPTESGTETHRVKLRKLLAEARTAEMKADQQEGKLISLDDICNMMTKLGATLKAQLNKFKADLPPVLYGLSHAEMTKRIGDQVDRTLQGICDELEAIKTDPPRPE
jgi:hypothetical protein